MKTEEAKVKDEVRRVLKELGAYVFQPVQTGYGKATLDFLCCINGRFIAIETKAPGRKLTRRQALIEREIVETGGEVVVIDRVEDVGRKLGYVI